MGLTGWFYCYTILCCPRSTMPMVFSLTFPPHKSQVTISKNDFKLTINYVGMVKLKLYIYIYFEHARLDQLILLIFCSVIF